MRNTSLWIATSLTVALVGCKSKGSAESKPSESKPSESKPAAAPTPTPAAGASDQMGTFTCKTIQNESAAGSNSACVDSTDKFDATVPVIHVTYRTADLPKSGDSYAIQWIASDVGAAAPANTVIATVNNPVPDVPTDTKSYSVNSYLTKPTNGWPVGSYRVEIKLADKLLTTAKFSIQ